MLSTSDPNVIEIETSITTVLLRVERNNYKDLSIEAFKQLRINLRKFPKHFQTSRIMKRIRNQIKIAEWQQGYCTKLGIHKTHMITNRNINKEEIFNWKANQFSK